jgi:hypothetical protein
MLFAARSNGIDLEILLLANRLKVDLVLYVVNSTEV